MSYFILKTIAKLQRPEQTNRHQGGYYCMRTLFYQPTAFPPTRFMGSKRGILTHIWDAVKSFPFNTVLDAFSGSGCVSYMFKSQGKSVISNDFLKYSYHMVN